MLFGVIDAEQLRRLVSVLESLLKWAAQVLRDLSQPVEPTVPKLRSARRIWAGGA